MLKNSLLIALLVISLLAETNSTKIKDNTDSNATISKNLQKIIAKEKKFKKEQKFYQGKDYNLSETAVDKSTVKKVPLIEPDYDFDMTDVYNDQ